MTDMANDRWKETISGTEIELVRYHCGGQRCCFAFINGKCVAIGPTPEAVRNKAITEKGAE